MTTRHSLFSSVTIARRADVQGLRALAVALVVLSHLGLPFARGGFVGVDVFFVISGFLIGGHLVRSLEETGRLHLRAFYARRARRILPAALLVAFVTLGAGLLLLPPLEWPSLGRLFAAVVLSGANVALALDGTNYRQALDPSPFQQFWSLGVEEQFYLCFPLLLAVLWILGRRSPRAFVVGIAVVTACSLLVSELLVESRPSWAFFLLPSRSWELGVGVLVALRVRRPRYDAPAFFCGREWTRRAFTALGLSAIVVTALVYDDATVFPGVTALVPVAGTALVILAGSGRKTRPLLALPPLQYLGEISYSVYLWHWPLLVIPAALFPASTGVPMAVLLLTVGASIGLAHLSRRYVELPIIHGAVGCARVRRSTRAGIRRRAVIRAGLAVALLAGVTAGAILPSRWADAAPQSIGSALGRGVPSTTPVFSGHVPPNMVPTLRGAASSTSEAHRNGCHLGDAAAIAVNDCVFGDPEGETTVALFGDSHAAHWLPALSTWAERNHVRVRSWTKAGCPSVIVDMVDAGSSSACATWRSRVLERMEAEKGSIDAVLVSNAYGLPFAADGLSPKDRWAQGAGELTKRLEAVTRVAFVANTPKLTTDPPICLSGHLDDPAFCGTARALAIDQGWIVSERAAVERAGGAYGDLNDAFCDARTCGSVIGSTLLYRDHSHLTEAWSTAMADVIGRVVARAT